MRWRILEVPDPSESRDGYRLAMRLNALGSLFFFETSILCRDELTLGFHLPILTRLERDTPRYLLELPRDHFKTSMVTEGRSMWRALPFNDADEAAMRELGYDDAWIAWMRRAHSPGRRLLIVSEVLENAIKLGWRIDWHYKENKFFRYVFPEVLPDAKCTWTNETKTQRSADHGPNGEGTFDFLGVGGALQSRHYHDITEDDVVGKDALESDTVMSKTHDYHKLLAGAFVDWPTANWTVVNNRWAPNDLSGWIRTNQKEFVIESHGALGGCCDDHPPGVPIFPEKYSVETLEQIRTLQGPYIFSHQYLNLAVNPEECIFQKDWLRFYTPVESPVKIGRHWLRHDVREGETIKDLDPNILIRSMVVDPNHAGAEGRARHAIVVTGFDPDTDRIYLLDVWAKSMSYDDLMANIFKMSELWNLHEFWLETVAAQKYLKYHIEYRNKIENRRLTVRELTSERSKNAKRTRIESLEPLFREGRFWVRRDQSAFMDEYYDYPGSRTVDILDALGYATQTWNAIHARKVLDIVRARRERFTANRKSITGY